MCPRWGAQRSAGTCGSPFTRRIAWPRATVSSVRPFVRSFVRSFADSFAFCATRALVHMCGRVLQTTNEPAARVVVGGLMTMMTTMMTMTATAGLHHGHVQQLGAPDPDAPERQRLYVSGDRWRRAPHCLVVVAACDGRQVTSGVSWRCRRARARARAVVRRREATATVAVCSSCSPPAAAAAFCDATR